MDNYNYIANIKLPIWQRTYIFRSVIIFPVFIEIDLNEHVARLLFWKEQKIHMRFFLDLTSLPPFCELCAVLYSRNNFNKVLVPLCILYCATGYSSEYLSFGVSDIILSTNFSSFATSSNSLTSCHRGSLKKTRIRTLWYTSTSTG